jgi:hypothetical protein
VQALKNDLFVAGNSHGGKELIRWTGNLNMATK